MTHRLRAGLVGMGAMGRNHARVLGQLEGVEFVGAADPAIQPGHGPGGVRIFSSADELIDEGIDMCVVAVPTKYHSETAYKLAEAGISALIEKPLAATAEEADALADLFENRGLIGAVGHIERFNPAVQQLRERLSGGALGEIYQVATRRISPFPSRIADVGVIFDLATHDIDMTSWVTGQSYASVSARSAFKSGRKHEDLVAATATLHDGTVVTHEVNWLSPYKVRRIIVTGEHGAMRADTLTADLTYYANGSSDGGWDALSQFHGVAQGDVTRYAFAKKEPLLAEHEAFRDAVAGGESRVVTLREGAATVRTAQAMVDSARANR